MIKAKAIRKILLTTMTMFLVLTVFSLSVIDSSDEVKVNMEISNDVKVNIGNVYLLGENNYLVRSSIILDDSNQKNNVLKILEALKESDTSKFSNGFRGVIPKTCRVLNVLIGKSYVTIDFSKEFLSVSEELEKKMIEAIVFSVLDYTKLDGVQILVEGNALEKYPNSADSLEKILTKSIGINKQYSIKRRDNLLSVILYYVLEEDDNYYYVPVTKYLNEDREKIDIIVEELVNTNYYDDDLISFLHNKTELLEYSNINDMMVLNFNKYLYDYDKKVLDEVLYSISYSVFDNYNVDVVMFEVNGEEVGHVSRK